MDFEKVEKFLRDHWPAVLMTAILVIPSTAGGAFYYFNDRISYLEKQIGALSLQAAEFEKKSERYQKRTAELSETVEKLTAEKLEMRKNDPIRPVSIDFEKLYTPSDTVIVRK